MNIKIFFLFLASIKIFQAHSQPFSSEKKFEIMQLTHDNSGHTIHNTQCFSPDDQWIVYDTRNNDTMISSTGNISMVNTRSGEIRDLYHTKHQTKYGP